MLVLYKGEVIHNALLNLGLKYVAWLTNIIILMID